MNDRIKARQNHPSGKGATVGSAKLVRTLSLRDLVFLSFGGQAALLSLLTYATGVVVYAKLAAPVIVILGTLIVLLNAAAVYGLSRRYGETGGYYIYALYNMTRRLGLETGWTYLFYSILYGAAYIMGAAYILRYALQLNPLLGALTVFFLASLFLALGIRPSARYAEVAASAELAALIFIVVADMALVGFKLYNPLTMRWPSLANIAAAILFAVGIPTGYGSITPLGGEAVRKDDIGRAAIIVVIIGGLLAAAVVYSMIDAGLYTDKINFILSARVPVLDFMKIYYREAAEIPLLFAAFNDGVLAPLSFMAATSRTIYAMAKNNMLPRQLSDVRGGHPYNAVLATILAYSILVISALVTAAKPFTWFLVYGSLAGMANLFVHISANVSYVIEEGKAVRRALIYGSLKAFSWITKRVMGVILGLGAALYSGWALLTSLVSSELKAQANIFLAWIIVGFLYAEVVDEIIGRARSQEQAQSS
ncbi:MAG: APC family permease [Acidilobus sp.]